MNIIQDCTQFAERHRGKHRTSGPHWSLIIRFVKLFDYAARLEMALQEIAERAGTSKNADWARRRALEALKEEVEK